MSDSTSGGDNVYVMDSSDEALLQTYVRNGSEAAFRELVHRHVNLVYAVARRLLRSDALAGDVTQCVFTDLAKAAPTLKPTQPVIAWLHLVARRTAIDFLRRESRRQAREQTAIELAVMNANESRWAEVEPLLDEALETLREEDRHALLLRYFENKSLRQMGEILGTSDDAAQKRVSRAAEQLRTALLRRGVTVSSAGLVADLSAQSMVSAPSALIASINANLIPVAVSSTTVVQGAALTALNKVLVASSIMLAAGLVYQTHLIATQRIEGLDLEQQAVNWQRQFHQLKQEQQQASSLLAAAEEELAVTQAGATEDAKVESALDDWMERVSQLNSSLDRMPEKRIPEMRFLSANDWFAVTLDNDLSSDFKVRSALSELRRLAKSKPDISGNFGKSLQAYSRDHGGESASRLDQILPYLNPKLGEDILGRYEFVRKDHLTGPDKMTEQWVFQEKGPVDEEFDVLINFTNRSSGYRYVSKLGDEMSKAWKTFRQENGNLTPTTADQLLPYLNPGVDVGQFREFWAARGK